MILVTGSLAFDHIMDFPGKFIDHILPDSIHKLNISFLVKDMHKSFGGTAGNIAYTLSLLGIHCGILAVTGKDFEPYKKFLDQNEIDTSLIKIVNGVYTSTAFGITDVTDNQIWGFYPGGDDFSDQLSVLEIKRKIDFGIIAPQNPRAILKFAAEYGKAKIGYLFDPGMQLPWFSAEDLKAAFAGAKIIIGNDYEIEVMLKKLKRPSFDDLSKQGKIIIITLGEKGSRIISDGQTISIFPAKAKSVTDPAGAGDAYRAGFIAGFMRGYSLKTCGQMGSLASVYTVEKYGTTTHRFTINQFERRYMENFGEKISL